MELGYGAMLETCSAQVLLHKGAFKTGLLGGTFNPVHMGHIMMAEECLNVFGFNKVLLIPSGKPPHKKDEFIASAKDRYNMLQLATLGRPGLEVSRLELEREGYTYTVDTLKALHKAEPETLFVFILGSDTLFELETWREPQSVMNMCEFLAFYRPGRNLSEITLQKTYLQDKYGARIQLAKNNGMDISSFEIRSKAARGEDISGMVPEEVRRYIIDNRIYGAGNDQG